MGCAAGIHCFGVNEGAMNTCSENRVCNGYANVSTQQAPTLNDTAEQCCLGDPRRTVSVYHLDNSFMETAVQAGFDGNAQVYALEPLIRKAGERVLCPRDGQMGAAYADTVRGNDDVGLATHMLSYTWGYTIGSIVCSLQQFIVNASLDQKRTFVWICCLCVNQHRVQAARARGESIPFEKFREAFGQRVRGVDHIIAMMSPWDNPQYLKRAWCVYEFSVAFSENKSLSILMPPADEDTFRKSIVEGKLEHVYEVLANVRIQDAGASEPSDKANILKSIDPSCSSYDASRPIALVNKAVREQLQKWFVEASATHLENQLQERNKVELAAHVAIAQLLVESVADYNRAKCLLCQGIGQHKKRDVALAEALRVLARLDLRQGNRDSACSNLGKALKIIEECGATNTVHYARLLVEINRYSEAKHLFEKLGVVKEPDYARALKHLAGELRCSGDVNAAFKAYKEADDAYTQCGAAFGPGYADLLSNIGECHNVDGNSQQALHWYEKSRMVYEAAGILSGVGLARLWLLIADEHMALGSEDAAIQACMHSKSLYEQAGVTHENELYRGACEVLSNMTKA